MAEKIKPEQLIQYKKEGKKFACLTAYDTPSARLVDEAGIEMVLVGDSLAMTVMGLDSTLPVTLDEMIYHTRAARRGVKRALLAVDLPYEASKGTPDEIAQNGEKLLEEGGAEAVKVEGAVPRVIEAFRKRNLPVIGHLGLTPQTSPLKVQARTHAEAEKLLKDAKEMEAAGMFALVLECIPRQLAETVTQSLQIPTIGIGAGPSPDGQILVWHDLLGWDVKKQLKFVRRYFDFHELAKTAIQNYHEDVIQGDFPSLEESFTMKEEELPSS